MRTVSLIAAISLTFAVCRASVFYIKELAFRSDFLDLLPVPVASLEIGGSSVSWQDEVLGTLRASASESEESGGRHSVVISVGIGRRRESPLNSSIWPWRRKPVSSFVFVSWGAHSWWRADASKEGTFVVRLENLDSDAIGFARKNGVLVLRSEAGAKEIISSGLSFIAKMISIGKTDSYVREFLENHAGFRFLPRKPLRKLTLKPELLKPGDLIGSANLGFAVNAVSMFLTGSRISHAAIVLRINSDLHVVESSLGGIGAVPVDSYLSGVDDVSRVLLRLRPGIPFDNEAAVERFLELQGSPYGFQTFWTGWADTARGNWPPPLSPTHLLFGLSILDRIVPRYVNLVFGQALNQRLGRRACCPVSEAACSAGPPCMTIDEILREISRRGLTFADVLAIPERDSWRYATGESRVCSSFVIDMYRAAGVFGGIEFEATEQVPRDVTQLAIFEDGKPDWCQGIDESRMCQISGSWVLEIPGFNSVVPYSHMNERCSCQPTNYSRVPDGC